MPQDTKPETPTEGGRVFREFPVGRIRGESDVGPAGYQNANAIRKQVQNSLDADAFQQLADAGISAFGFEFEVSTTANHLLPPFMGLSGAIGLSMIWLTKVEDAASHGPHMYIFGREGENGPEPLGDAPTSGKTVGCFFAAHFATEEPLNPEQWEEAFGNVGVDAGGGRGLLSGEVTLHPTSDAALVWKKNREVWRAFVADFVISGTSGDVTVEQTSYEHYRWLLGQLGFMSTPGGASWAPPEHSFWQKGSLRIPEWGGGSAGGGGGTPDEVTFPSGETLPVIPGAENRDNEQWQLSEKYWDPQYSGNPLLDTSGDNRNLQLSEDFSVGNFAESGGRTFDKARIDPAFVRFLQAFRDKINREVAPEGEEMGIFINSGYRTWKHNRRVKDWPEDDTTIDSIEKGPWMVSEDIDNDGEDEQVAYDWKLTMTDGSGPRYVDLTRSEHCAGRGADIEVKNLDTDEVYDDALELGKMALNTPLDEDIEGVSPCDTRVGIDDDDHWIHVDIKPRPWAPAAAYWDYVAGRPDGWGELTQLRDDIDRNHDCGNLGAGTPEYHEERLYVVTNHQAFLRDHENQYAVADDENNPLYQYWTETQDVHYDTQGDEVWELDEAVRVRLVDSDLEPDNYDQGVVKTESVNGEVLGWTNFSNLNLA